MLFNSYEFIFCFLPLAFACFYGLGRYGSRKLAIAFLSGASLFFYGWWNPAYLWVLVSSILFNYAVGGVLSGKRVLLYSIPKKAMVVAGISCNLLLLGYFKYANFALTSINFALESDLFIGTIILPLGISFFTFQQITFLIDSYKGETNEYNFLQYCLFVTFFPQLIAGPIVHHKEMLPQFNTVTISRLNLGNLSVGVSIFTIGLLKKTVLADSIAVYATPVFSSAENGVSLGFFTAWGGTLAYTLQIYFDFSGYSDMAIGLGWMFGILLPLNFNSPYKANNIIEFWKRWHITLSRFLKDYLYIPLGGNRKGQARRYFNLMATMLLGGLWHGAGYTFVIWGALHGLYLAINHGFRSIRLALGHDLTKSNVWGRGVARLTTFVAVSVAWIFFKASSLEGAQNVMHGVIGLNGFVLPEVYDYHFLFFLCLLLAISWVMPNTQEFMQNYNPSLEFTKVRSHNPLDDLQWKPGTVYGILLSIALVVSLIMLSKNSEFLYFQF